MITFCWLRRWLRESNWSITTANSRDIQARYAKCEESVVRDQLKKKGMGYPARTRSFRENVVLVILALTSRFLCDGQRLLDCLDDVLIVGLDETTEDLTGFL